MMGRTKADLTSAARLNSAGFTLVELLIVVTITGFVSLGVAEFIFRIVSTMNTINVLNSRDAIVGAIRRTAMNPTSMNRTMNQVVNSGSLSACITSRGNPCGTVIGQQIPFTLYSLTSSGTPAILAGPFGTPAYYNADGSSCSASSKCAIQASAYFIARCYSGGAVLCGTGIPMQAMTIEVHYIVTTTSALSNSMVTGTINSPPIMINAAAIGAGAVGTNL